MVNQTVWLPVLFRLASFVFFRRKKVLRVFEQHGYKYMIIYLFWLNYPFKTLSVLILIFMILYFFRGQNFILNHLRMEDVSCYWESLLADFSKLLKYKPKRKSNYNQIIHKASRSEL